jgi:hypothetical protein
VNGQKCVAEADFILVTSPLVDLLREEIDSQEEAVKGEPAENKHENDNHQHFDNLQERDE